MPNKATSKRQFRFLKAVASGKAKRAGGLSPAKAGELLGHQSPRGLPEMAPKGKPKRLSGQAKRVR